MSEKEIYNTIQRVIFPTVAELDKSSLFVRWPNGNTTVSEDMFGISLTKGTVLGRVDGFEQDEAGGEGDEGGEVPLRLLAA